MDLNPKGCWFESNWRSSEPCQGLVSRSKTRKRRANEPDTRARLANDVRLLVLAGIVFTWLTCLALLSALAETQAGPVLYRLTVLLPAVLVVLIAAGVLHRPDRRSFSVTVCIQSRKWPRK